jgi:hypothetical protein
MRVVEQTVGRAVEKLTRVNTKAHKHSNVMNVLLGQTKKTCLLTYSSDECGDRTRETICFCVP